MNGIFAKWVFGVAFTMGAGADQDVPPMRQVTLQTPEIYQVLQALNRPPCPPEIACPPDTYTLLYQRFCVAPGVYTVALRLGLIAQEPAGGKLWLEAPGEDTLLSAFNAVPGAPAYVATSLQVSSAGTCYRLRYEANRPLEIIADPAVSFLTIGR